MLMTLYYRLMKKRVLQGMIINVTEIERCCGMDTKCGENVR
jgi:hypothetical protein